MPATVFLSYRQENEDWTEQVRALAERLRSKRLPAEIMTSGKAFEPGDQLSPGDIAFIRKLYPGR